MPKNIDQKAERLIRKENEKANDLRWWLDDEPHRKIWSVTERIDRHMHQRHADYLACACLYDDAELAAIIGGSSAFVSSVPEVVGVNVVRRQVDSCVATLTKERPLPMAITNGAGYAARRRAKALSRFFEGALQAAGYYKVRPLRIRDGVIFGSGFAHNYRVGKKLVHERVFPWELAVDPREAMRGNPRSLYWTTLVDKLVLKERFPQHEEAIDTCDSRTNRLLWDAHEETSNLAVVRSAWHLRSGPDADDGAYAICISNATLASGKYERDYFPFSHYRFSPGLVGWFGEGMVRHLASLQAEINELMLRLQESAYLTGSYCWVPDGSGIEVDTIDNAPMSVIRSALKPEFITPPPWHPQLFQYFEKLRTEMPSAITGQSEMMTRGQIPPGLEAGVAIRRYHQIAAEKWTPQVHEDQRDCIDTAWQLFDLMEEIGDLSIDVEHRVHGRVYGERIDYSKVRLERDSFTLGVYPISFLAATPEDKWSQVQEMAKSGLFDQEDILLMMDMPDVQHVLRKRGAARMVIEKIIERILEADPPGSVKVAPEPTMNLDLCVALGTTSYLIAKWIDEVPEESTRELLNFVLLARQLRDSTGGPQPGSQSAEAPPEEAEGMPPVNQPGVGPGYVEPASAPMPEGAVAPSAIPPVM
jgi:hypothetical protein